MTSGNVCRYINIMSKDLKKIKTGKTAIFFILIISCIILFTVNINAAGDPYKYSLCDIRVAYIYENAENIDWPILYYLNDNYGCRIDLISLRPGNKFQQKFKPLEDKEIYLFNLTVDETDSLWAQNSISRFFADRYPDVVIFGDIKGNQGIGVEIAKKSHFWMEISRALQFGVRYDRE